MTKFQQERKQYNIRKRLADGDKARVQEFSGMMDGINKGIKDINNEVSEVTGKARAMIKNFGQERKHYNIKKRLADGDKARLQEFSGMMDGITKSITGINDEVSELTEKTRSMMKGFQEEHTQMSADWQKMTSILLAKKRNSGATTTEHKIKTEEKIEKVEKPEKKPAKAAKPLSLEEKILAYISKHKKDGVKIGEMEGPLGVTKMKLGKLAKTLMEKGKLRKEKNVYFPAK